MDRLGHIENLSDNKSEMSDYETSLPSADDRHNVNESVNYQLKTNYFY